MIRPVEPLILRHRADLASHLLDVEVLRIAPVVVHRSVRGPVQAEHEPEQRALAGPRLAGDGDEPAGTGMNRDVVQDQLLFPSLPMKMRTCACSGHPVPPRPSG